MPHVSPLHHYHGLTTHSLISSLHLSLNSGRLLWPWSRLSLSLSLSSQSQYRASCAPTSMMPFHNAIPPPPSSATTTFTFHFCILKNSRPASQHQIHVCVCVWGGRWWVDAHGKPKRINSIFSPLRMTKRRQQLFPAVIIILPKNFHILSSSPHTLLRRRGIFARRIFRIYYNKTVCTSRNVSMVSLMSL